MADDSSNPKEISLGNNFGDVAVKVNGVRVEVHTDGSVDAYTQGTVKVHPAANDIALKPKIAPETGPEIRHGPWPRHDLRRNFT